MVSKFVFSRFSTCAATQRRFREWVEAGHRPWLIPADPKKFYVDRGVWVSWDDFLGVSIAGDMERVREFMSYEDARRFMRALRRSGSGGKVGAHSLPGVRLVTYWRCNRLVFAK